MKGLFNRLSLQRASFAGELLPHAHRLGGNAPREGSPAAALHRGLMAMETALRHNDRVIVGKVLLGDNAVLAAYAEALDGMLPPDTREVVERQYAVMHESHGQIPAMSA